MHCDLLIRVVLRYLRRQNLLSKVLSHTVDLSVHIDHERSKAKHQAFHREVRQSNESLNLEPM